VSSASDDDGAGELEEHGYPQPYPYHEAMPVRLAEQPPECTVVRRPGVAPELRLDVGPEPVSWMRCSAAPRYCI
jgi:hypothetical protein